MGEIQSSPSQLPPTTYCLVSAEAADRDSLDLIGFVASCWKLRRTFAVSAAICMLPGCYWALAAKPRVEFTVVLQPPTSGLGASGRTFLIPPSAMADQCEEVVFPRLFARLDGDSGQLEFERVLADAWHKQGSSALVLGSSAPAGQPNTARKFLNAAAADLMDLQQPEIDRYLGVLNSRIDDLERRRDSIGKALASPSIAPGSIEAMQLESEIVRIESQRAESILQKSLCGPAEEIREVLETPGPDLIAWRTRRALTALAGSVAVAAIVSAVIALVGGVRRRLREEVTSA